MYSECVCVCVCVWLVCSVRPVAVQKAMENNNKAMSNATTRACCTCLLHRSMSINPATSSSAMLFAQTITVHSIAWRTVQYTSFIHTLGQAFPLRRAAKQCENERKNERSQQNNGSPKPQDHPRNDFFEGKYTDKAGHYGTGR